jgi:transcriptional regulator with XRE-family HTH domain
MQTVHNKGMTLQEYLDNLPTDKRLSDEAFGLLVGLSQSQVSRLRRGINRPSWATIDAIALATKNKVTAADWKKVEADPAPPHPQLAGVRTPNRAPETTGGAA